MLIRGASWVEEMMSDEESVSSLGVFEEGESVEEVDRVREEPS